MPVDRPFTLHIPRTFVRSFSSASFFFVVAVLLECSGAYAAPAPAEGVSSLPTGTAGPALSSSGSGTGAAARSLPTGTTDPALSSSASGTGAAEAGGSREGERRDSLVDLVHAELSHGIQGTAAWMDSFFGDWRYASELNESYIRFGYSIFMEKESPLYRKPDIQIRFILPQLRQRTKLVLTGTPRDNRDFSAVSMAAQKDQISGSDERNISAAVHQTFFESAQQSFIMRLGAKLHNFSPVVVLGPRYRVLFPLDEWILRFTEDLALTSNVGWESASMADLERRLPYNLFFRVSNSWIWKEHVDGYIAALAFTIGQPLSYRRAIDYEWVNIFETAPVSRLTEIDLRVRYRQRLWRDWFFFEIAPQYRFPRDRSFEATPGVLFRFEMLLGNYANYN